MPKEKDAAIAGVDDRLPNLLVVHVWHHAKHVSEAPNSLLSIASAPWIADSRQQLAGHVANRLVGAGM